MKTSSWYALVGVVFSIWAAFTLMKSIHNRKATPREKLIYSISQFIFYVAASILCSYLISEFVEIDDFQLVLIFFLFLISYYVGCGFMYDVLQYSINNKS